MDDRLVTLTVYYSLIEARICVSMLEAHGIFALAPTELANNAPHLMTALGGIPVMVIGRDYEAARALLADVETRAESEPPPPARPILRRLWDAMVGALVLLVAGLPRADPPQGRAQAGWRGGLRAANLLPRRLTMSAGTSSSRSSVCGGHTRDATTRPCVTHARARVVAAWILPAAPANTDRSNEAIAAVSSANLIAAAVE